MNIAQNSSIDGDAQKKTYNRPFTLNKPNANSLDMCYYRDEAYNDIRRSKLMLFSDCLGENRHFITKSHYMENNRYKLVYDTLTHRVPSVLVDIIKSFVLNPLTKDDIIRYVEKSCVNRTIEKAKNSDIICTWENSDFVGIYHAICYKIACNLDTNSPINSDYIINKILSKDIVLMDIASMSSKQLCPNKYKDIEDKFNKRYSVERKVKYSELYKCRKCKKNQTVTERMYNRSWDEGVSLKITCVYCNHSWGG